MALPTTIDPDTFPMGWVVMDAHLSTRTYVTPLFAPYAVPCHGDRQPATHVSRWYNRAERSWVVAYCRIGRDGSPMQVGGSTYVYDLAAALHEARYMVAEAY